MPEVGFNDPTTYKPGFASVDFAVNFEQGGNLYQPPKINQPQPKSLENLTLEFLQKQKAASEAIRTQHKIDNIYERVMGTAPTRDIEVLPPENPAEAFDPTRTRMRNVTPIDEKEAINDLLQQQLKHPRRPSSATPPVNVNNSGARISPIVDIQATPVPAEIRAPVSRNFSPEIRPSSLPTPAGRLVAPAIGGLVDFGLRVVSGQSPQQAAFGAAASTAGSVAGATVGSLLGPVGAFTGGIVGGMIVGAIADYILNQNRSRTAELLPEPLTLPFHSGFIRGAKLDVEAGADITNLYGYRLDWYYTLNVYGPVLGCRLVPGKGVEILAGNRTYGDWNPNYLEWQEVASISGSSTVHSYGIRKITRRDNNNLPLTVPPQVSPIDNRAPQSISHPGNNNYVPPSGYLGASQQPKPSNYISSGFPAGGTPRGDSPYWIPHGGLNPKANPNPTTTPSNLGGNLPNFEPTLNNTPNPNTNANLLPDKPSFSPEPKLNPKDINPPAVKIEGSSNKPKISGPPVTQDNNPLRYSGLPTGTKAPTTAPKNNLRVTTAPEPTPQPQTQTGAGTGINICETLCKIFWVEVQVPIVSCELQNNEWKSKRESKTVKVLATADGNEIIKTQTEFEELAKIAEEICNQKNNNECVLTLPERYQLSPEGHCPQVICVFREIKEDGALGNDYYPLTIPHPNFNKAPTQAPLPVYQKGKWEGILTLKDNSKIFVNAKDLAEAERMLEEIKKLVVPSYLQGSFIKVGPRKGQALKEIRVKLFKIDFYPTGTKNSKPEWIRYYRD